MSGIIAYCVIETQDGKLHRKTTMMKKKKQSDKVFMKMAKRYYFTHQPTGFLKKEITTNKTGITYYDQAEVDITSKVNINV